MMARFFLALVLMAAGGVAVLLYQHLLPAPLADAPLRGSPPGRGGILAQPLLVETTAVTRGDVAERLQIVGNLVGAASVEVAPKLDGRLERVDVRLGDRVSQGQAIARIEDDELQQRVSQAQASFDVARATVRQREADLVLASTTRERARSLFDRALVSGQELDDAEAVYQAAAAQGDLARAQFDQAQAYLEELRINLANTVILSPVDGFIGRRYLDPGAYVTSSTAVVSVVDVSLVRLVANLVERDLRLVSEGVEALIDVDAFPGETFVGEVARIAPVLDTATRTAEIEIEVPNPDFRLKPGMYARVSLEVGTRSAALVVPREAVVTRTSARGVFRVADVREQPTVEFVALVIGLEDDTHLEVVDGVAEGDVVVTTGSAGLQHGDPVALGADGPPDAGGTAFAGRTGGAPADPGRQ